jgi:hypothetical protein
MTDEQSRTDRHPTDEPDGTPAFEASLRPPGETVSAAGDDAARDDSDAEFDGVGRGSGDPLSSDSRAGYDPADVAGDTDAVRPA